MPSNQQAKQQQRGMHIVLHWFRHGDLRLHDNPALVHSCKASAKEGQVTNKKSFVIPFFAFDTKVFGNNAKSEFGSLKCGPRRAKFVLESIQDLHNGLRRNGSGLLVSYGQEPHEFVAQLTRDISAAAVASDNGSVKFTLVCQDEVLKEETDAVRAMKQALPPGCKLETPWGSTMYELNALPFSENLVNMPDTFTPFRNKVEKTCEILPPLPIPSRELNACFPSADDAALRQVISPLMDQMSIPSLKDLGYSDDQITEANTLDPRGVMEFCGGESAALARVKDYIWTQDMLRIYFDTRNGMLGANYSTKLSPWLAHGCVSSRFIAKECRSYEKERGIQNKSTYWVVFELLWRDYCKFFALKHGNRIFYPNGILPSATRKKEWKTFDKTLEAWKEGRTGYPLVDANMRELKATGFMSNRGRQNVCSFLALDLQQDWRRGGDYFETHLIDYDVYSNWYNWCAGAGMTGGRLNRFNIVKQSKDYDQLGEYVRHWLPELKNVPTELVHEPWKMTQFQQMEYGVRLGVDYPHRSSTTAPPPQLKGETGRRIDDRKQGPGGRVSEIKQRQKNPHNRHQKYDMKSLKEAQINTTNV